MKAALLLVLVFLCTTAFAKIPYPEIKTWAEQADSQALTKAQRLENFRDIVRKGNNGNVRLNRVFRNFEGRRAIDPDIPGLRKNLLLTASDNINVVKGAERTHLYATRVHNDPRFRLLGVDIPQLGANRKMITDKDILFEHQSTGMRCRIESKDVKLSSQISNREKYMEQMDKMASEYERTGELQAWVNRNEVDPVLKSYGESKDIIVRGKIPTGEVALRNATANGTPHFNDLLNDLDTRAHQYAKTSDANRLRTTISSNESALLKSKLPVEESGAAMTDIAEVGATGALESASTSGWLGKVSKYGGPVLIAVPVGYMIWQYNNGSISRRQLIKEGSALGVGLIAGIPGAAIGGYLAAKAGAPLNVIPGVGQFLYGGVCFGGVLIGGFVTGFPAAIASDKVVEHIYENIDAAQQAKVDAFIKNSYGLSD